jgi:hypothetical protein
MVNFEYILHVEGNRGKMPAKTLFFFEFILFLYIFDLVTPFLVS